MKRCIISIKHCQRKSTLSKGVCFFRKRHPSSTLHKKMYNKALASANFEVRAVNQIVIGIITSDIFTVKMIIFRIFFRVFGQRTAAFIADLLIFRQINDNLLRFMVCSDLFSAAVLSSFLRLLCDCLNSRFRELISASAPAFFVYPFFCP